MAEAEKDEYSSGLPMWQAIPNSLKWLWNKGIYDNMRYYRTKKEQLVVRKSFLISYLVDILKEKIDRLKNMEGSNKEYGGVENSIKPDVLNVYDKLGGYTSTALIDKELDYIKNGTGLINIRYRIGTHDYTIPLPDKKPLRFPDGYVQYARYYGRDERGKMWEQKFKPVIAQMIKDSISDVDLMGIDQTEAKMRKTALQTFGDLSNDLLSTFFTKDEEGSWYNMFNRMKSKLENLKASMKTYEALWNKLMNNRPQEVVYLHTYYRVKQVNDNGKRLNDPGVVHPAPGFKKMANEVDWGLDDRGMPLEVVPAGGHRFVDRFGRVHDLSEGDILMDAFIKFSTATPGGIIIRRVRRDFIEPIDLLEAVNYIHTEWDNFRDDFRDGRWHPKSLTVSDYIMAASPALEDEWKRKRKPNKIDARYANYEMNLNGNRAPFNAPFSNRRKPSDLNPAFDLRTLKIDWKGKVLGIAKPFRYIGSKRYYSPMEICSEEQEDPNITSRGLSMFVIEEICRKGKTAAEIRDELISIGKKTGGYDYGPRTFGDPDFCIDPFAVDFEKINKNRGTRKFKMA